VAKSKSGEFYSFDEVLKQLNIDEGRLKRLVSEGEIRAFREGDAMRFKRTEIDNLAGRSGRGSQTSDTSLTEITLEDESQPTVNVGRSRETLPDDLGGERKSGMRTAEISSQDTFIDKADDIGMSTEPIDFTEEEGEAEEIEDMGVGRGRPAAATQQRRRVVVEEARTSPLLVLALVVTMILGLFGIALTKDIAEGPPLTSLGKWFTKNLGGQGDGGGN
jgi:excisionase family DNA binding protein